MNEKTNSKNYDSHVKVCGNCNYFVCTRQLSPNQQYVLVAPDEKGTCFGKYKNMKRRADDRFPACWKIFDLLNEIYDEPMALQKLQAMIAKIKA